MSDAKAFFLSELPPLIAQIKEKLGARVPKVTYDVEFEIEGEGTYSLAIKNGEVSVRRGSATDPLLAMVFSKQTFDEALRDVIRPRLVQLAEIDPSAVDALLQSEMTRHLQGRKPVLPEEMIKQARALPLCLVIEIEPKEKHSFALRLAGAEDDDPTVTLQVKRDDLEALLKGTLNAQEAVKQQRLRMKGAVTTAMALLSRLLV